MREIKNPMTQDEAEKLIGAKIQIVTAAGAFDGGPIVVYSVKVDSEGDPWFNDSGSWGWLSAGESDTLQVLSEPTPAPAPTETPREAVERLRSELEAAEAALASEGLPDDWVWDTEFFASSDVHDSAVSAECYVGYGESHLYIRVRAAAANVPFDAIAAVVDRAREARAAVVDRAREARAAKEAE